MNQYKDFFSGKNVLITGGLGFIGSNLAIELVKFGANVTIIDVMLPNQGANIFNIIIIINNLYFMRTIHFILIFL